MKPPNKFRLCATLLVAAAFSIWTRAGWRRIKSAFLIWFGLLGKGEHWASEELFNRRMEICRQCPVYWHPLRSCGTPLKRELRPLGCWCNVQDGKSRIKEATCWLVEQGFNDEGWGKIQLDQKPP